ncbi:MAG: TRAP transporter small permease [Lachnospiraceae bacterium]|nr:TRAP transporter small permease [Lachnospiraceae bacterium]
MRTIRNGITRILNGLAGISFLAMVVLTCWQVFTRYILQNPSTWAEELVGYLFAWMSLFGVCIVTRERGHMNIPILVDKLGTSGKKIMNCLGEVIAFLFSAIILVFGGYQIVILAMGQMTSSLGVPIGIFYIILPLCGVLNMIYIVMNVIDILKESPDEEEVV